MILKAVMTPQNRQCTKGFRSLGEVRRTPAHGKHTPPFPSWQGDGGIILYKEVESI